MRIRTLLVGTAAAAAVTLMAGPAYAGEVTGNGKPTGAPSHTNSICAYSGLEDGSEDPTAPSGPGAPPQNWGHVPKELRAFLTSIGENPGSACNGHSGALAGGGGEPAR